MRIVFLGPPGAGKGTQAKMLTSSKGIAHISTGEMLREAVASGSELGKKVKAILDRGDLVSDDVVIAMLRERLGRADCNAGFLLDGFPRTVPQAEALDKLLKELGKDLTAILDLAVPEQVLLERIKNRAASGSGRSDDAGEVATNRLKVYWEQTAPVSAYYKGSNRLKSVDGLGSVEEVQSRIVQALGK